MKIRNFRVRAMCHESAHESILSRLALSGETPAKPIKIWECQPGWWETSVVIEE